MEEKRRKLETDTDIDVTGGVGEETPINTPPASPAHSEVRILFAFQWKIFPNTFIIDNFPSF